MPEKADPFHHRQRWEDWKRTMVLRSRFPGDKHLSEANAKLIIEYLLDMEAGYNVATKGRRSYIRLNTIRQRINWILANLGEDDITKTDARTVLTFFNRMKDGTIQRHNGKPFNSTVDYIKIFTAFWHWYQRRESGRFVPDIAAYLASEPPVESAFVYFTIDDLRTVSNHAKYPQKVFMWLLFDSGIRSPTELMSLRIRDFQLLQDKGIFELDIKDQYAKTFGRKIKLLLSSDLLKDYLAHKNLDDPFFDLEWKSFIRYLRRVFVRALGDRPTKAGKSFGQIKPYDFRHSAACYWLPRYQQESAFKYRFGWKENRMIHYYTKLLGMQDTITADMLIDAEAKTKLEKDLEVQKQANLLMEERLRRLEEMIHRGALAEINAKLETTAAMEPKARLGN